MATRTELNFDKVFIRRKRAITCSLRHKAPQERSLMKVNYGLSPKEVAEGYVLTCQADHLGR